MTTASYIPLIGLGNVVSITEATGGLVAYTAGTINGATPAGRAGTQRTSLLLSLDTATADNIIPFDAVANLAIITVEAPPGFSTPSVLASTSFDYSTILPVTHAELLVSGFDCSSGAWPTNFASFYGEVTSPPNLVSLFMKITGAAVPSASHPYGTLTYTLAGKAVTADVAKPLIRVDIDFGASVSN